MIAVIPFRPLYFVWYIILYYTSQSPVRIIKAPAVLAFGSTDCATSLSIRKVLCWDFDRATDEDTGFFGFGVFSSMDGKDPQNPSPSRIRALHTMIMYGCMIIDRIERFWILGIVGKPPYLYWGFKYSKYKYRYVVYSRSC